jgi:hypothetical protein
MGIHIVGADPASEEQKDKTKEKEERREVKRHA